MYDVVDYCQPTMPVSGGECASIIVSPFHTGAIGLLPETEVHVSLTEGDAGCEALIRPYDFYPDNLMQLDCTMEDGPGIVGRLVDAISELGINIVNEVSAAIDQVGFQRVSMLLDWTTSKYKQKTPSDPGERRYYYHFRSVFPTATKRYVELFESIVLRCGNVIVTQPTDGVDLPMLSLRELTTPANVLANGTVTVKRYISDSVSPPKPYHVLIEFPRALYAMLCQSLQVRRGQPLWYILLSEPDTKTLRAFFPRPEIIPQIVHLAFFHLDIPQAYGAILHPLADAGFNILTSLIRRHNEGKNVVEAVLQSPINSPVIGAPRDASACKELCLWGAKLMLEQVTRADVDLLRLCDLRIGLPLYPRPASRDTLSFSELVDRCPHPIRASRPAPPITAPDNELTTFVRRGREIAKKTGLFLSYPDVARLHAALVKERLGKLYRISEIVPNGEPVESGLRRELQECDYFVGIWFPEGGNGRRPAQRLVLELGAAIALGKRAIILYAEGLDLGVLAQVGHDVLAVELSFVNFESQTLQQLVGKYCPEHFREAHYSDTNGILNGRRPTVDAARHLFGGFPTAQVPELSNDRSREVTTMADWARKFIRDRGTQGVTAGELHLLISAQIPIQRTYLYSLLRRLRDQQKDIGWRREDKRYYSIERTPESS